MGCEEELLRKDLQQHENDHILHLQIAVETVYQQQKEMKAMKEEQRAMKEEQRAMKEEQRAMKEELELNPCVFKMPRFRWHRLFKDEWYSPPFYIHPGSCFVMLRQKWASVEELFVCSLKWKSLHNDKNDAYTRAG